MAAAAETDTLSVRISQKCAEDDADGNQPYELRFPGPPSQSVEEACVMVKEMATIGFSIAFAAAPGDTVKSTPKRIGMLCESMRPGHRYHVITSHGAVLIGRQEDKIVPTSLVIPGILPHLQKLCDEGGAQITVLDGKASVSVLSLIPYVLKLCPGIAATYLFMLGNAEQGDNEDVIGVRIIKQGKDIAIKFVTLRSGDKYWDGLTSESRDIIELRAGEAANGMFVLIEPDGVFGFAGWEGGLGDCVLAPQTHDLVAIPTDTTEAVMMRLSTLKALKQLSPEAQEFARKALTRAES